MLVDNTGDNTQLACFFCKITTGARIRVNQGCTGCKKSFHTNCFTAFHCHEVLGADAQRLAKIVQNASKERNGSPARVSKHVGNIVNLNLDYKRKEKE